MKSVTGYLLKRERLKQDKGQKEVCYGICVTSYLSKIENGVVNPEPEIMKKLFERLGISICLDDEMQYFSKVIDEYYNMLEYNYECDLYDELLKNSDALEYSELAIDWIIIQGLEKDNTYELLWEYEDYMSDRQKGYYYILALRYLMNRPSDSRKESLKKREEIVEYGEKAYKYLKSSFSLNELMTAYYWVNDYLKIHQMESEAVSIAVREGNVYQLANYYMLNGTAYACIDMNDMMMKCYKRAMNILRNTNWQESLKDIYYNIGATLISEKKYDEALLYLDRCDNDSLHVLHKKAIGLIRMGDIEQGKNCIVKAEEIIAQNGCMESDLLKFEEARMECIPNFLESKDYMNLLEKLISKLEKERHFGHIFFYKDILIETYIKQRQYKKALDFMNGIMKRKSC